MTSVKEEENSSDEEKRNEPRGPRLNPSLDRVIQHDERKGESRASHSFVPSEEQLDEVLWSLSDSPLREPLTQL